MSAAVVLHRVWASVPQPRLEVVRQRPRAAVTPQVAFYRKYTEAMLRRYQKMSMEAGRVPSLLGRELFRGQVTNCQVKAFDDVVIFVHDVENCLAKLDFVQGKLVEKIALQEYTQVEVAGMMGLPIRSVVRKYESALDRLTTIFLARNLLNPELACQAVETVENPVTCSMYVGS